MARTPFCEWSGLLVLRATTRAVARFDRRSVRCQIGMVVQDGALQPGDILDSIIGIDDDPTFADVLLPSPVQ